MPAIYGAPPRNRSADMAARSLPIFVRSFTRKRPRTRCSPASARNSGAAALARLRESLGPHEQSLLTLRVHVGLSWKEIAEILGTDPAALRKRFERLKAQLRQRAEAAGLLGH